MSWLETLLQDRDAIVKVIVGFGTPVALALIAWVSGFARWVGKLIEESIHDRRSATSDQKNRYPSRTLALQPMTQEPFLPWLSDSQAGEGRPATTAIAFIMVTNTWSAPVAAAGCEFVLPWRLRLRKHRKTRTQFTSMSRVTQLLTPNVPTQWNLNVQIYPRVSGKRLVGNLRVTDQFGNPHSTPVCFVDPRAD